MNHLVLLDNQTSDLEKILSGVKRMVIREARSQDSTISPVSRGDYLYFYKEVNNCNLQVKATVTRVINIRNGVEKNLTYALKELQPRLQLTEDQYNYWSEKECVLLVEFESTQKIKPVHVALEKIPDVSHWITFKTFDQIQS